MKLVFLLLHFFIITISCFGNNEDQKTIETVLTYNPEVKELFLNTTVTNIDSDQGFYRLDTTVVDKKTNKNIVIFEKITEAENVIIKDEKSGIYTISQIDPQNKRLKIALHFKSDINKLPIYVADDGFCILGFPMIFYDKNKEYLKNYDVKIDFKLPDGYQVFSTARNNQFNMDKETMYTIFVASKNLVVESFKSGKYVFDVGFWGLNQDVLKQIMKHVDRNFNKHNKSSDQKNILIKMILIDNEHFKNNPEYGVIGDDFIICFDSKSLDIKDIQKNIDTLSKDYAQNRIPIFNNFSILETPIPFGYQN